MNNAGEEGATGTKENVREVRQTPAENELKNADSLPRRSPKTRKRFPMREESKNTCSNVDGESLECGKHDNDDNEVDSILVSSQHATERESSGVSGLFNTIITSFVRNDMLFNVGYRMNISLSEYDKRKKPPFGNEKVKGWSLNVKVGSLLSLHADLGMTQPLIRIHTVNLESGEYVLLKEAHSLSPVESKSCTLCSTSTIPYWDESIQLHAPLSLFCKPSTLILFELLDTKKPIGNSKNGRSKICLQRIAWAFLRPLGDNKTVNFGYPCEWDKVLVTREDNEEDRLRIEKEKGAICENTISTNGTYKEKEKLEFQKEVYTSHALQLYSFQDDNMLEALQRKVNGWNHFQTSIPMDIGSLSLDDVPESYVQWRRHVLNKAPGLLSIQVGAKKSQSLSCVEKEAVQMSEVEEQRNLYDVITMAKYNALARMRVSMMKINRGSQESCSIPQKLLHRIPMGPEGAMSLSFSNSGSMLAVAGLSCDSSSSHFANGKTTYALRIFCPNNGSVLWFDLAAHHGVVYQIKWSNDDTMIVTCSGDGTCKVWDMNVLIKNHTDGVCIPPPHSVKAYFLRNVAMHQPPVSIYCVAILDHTPVETSVQGNILKYVTGAFDGYLRIWKGDTLEGLLTHDGENHPPHHGSVHSLTIDERTKHLYSGDSVGVIYIWRPDSQGVFQLFRKFRRDDLEGKIIMTLLINPDRSKAQLLVFAAPSTLRIYSLNNYKVHSKLSGALVKGSYVKATLSADGRYVICGTEDNRSQPRKQGSDDHFCTPSSSRSSRIKVWEAESGNVISCSLSDMIFPHSIRDISWNGRQHMIAVATAGSNTSVSIFVAEKENILKTLQKAENNAASDYFRSSSTLITHEKSCTSLYADIEETNDIRKVDNRPITSIPAPSPSASSLNQEERRTRTAEILARIREKKRLQDGIFER